jgi:hypothetical protein
METKRLHYIDWLRVLVVLALIPFHASLTYLRYGVVYIKEPVSGLASLPISAGRVCQVPSAVISFSFCP